MLDMEQPTDFSYYEPDINSERKSTDSNPRSRGIEDSTKRLRELAKLNTTDHPHAAARISEEILPGIPSSAPQSAVDPSSQRNAALLRPIPPRSKSSNDYTASTKPSSNHSRLRTRTLEQGLHNAPAAPLALRNRSRVGSTNEAATWTSYTALEEKPMGFISTVSPVPEAVARPDTARSKASKHSIRERHRAKPSKPQIASYFPLNAERLRNLMRRTKGLMQGPLLHRKDATGGWYLAYCSISAFSGKLLKESSSGRAPQEILISDLRGCRVQASYDHDSQSPILYIRAKQTPTRLQLRPKFVSDFNLWFAAFLCWQPLRSQQESPSSVKERNLTSLPRDTDKEQLGLKRESGDGKDVSIIKVGKILLWTADEVEGSTEADLRAQDSHIKSQPSSKWTKVSCILKENGKFQLLTNTDIHPIATIWLSKLTRSAIQRLSPSVLGCEHCIAIYPQYARYLDCSLRLRPIYIRGETRMLYEVWFVLLRALATPELYGPTRDPFTNLIRSTEVLPGISDTNSPELFRVERSFHVQIGEMRLNRSSVKESPPSYNNEAKYSGELMEQAAEYYVQVLVDAQVKAKTKLKSGKNEVLWYENIDVLDLPATATFAVIQVRRLASAPPEKAASTLNSATEYWSGSHKTNEDTMVGEVTLPLSNFCTKGFTDDRWSLYNELGEASGNVSMRVRVDREIILMDAEYGKLSDLLHNFASGLCQSLAEKLSPELTRLSDFLLNIYQVSGRADEWLMFLAEEEIDGIGKEVPPNRLMFRNRVSSNESKESLVPYVPSGDREGQVREFNRSAIAEANLLFRGNSLMSKALDTHMQRLGKEYLEETLGPKLRDIYEKEPDVEVDPSKISPTASLPYNWVRLFKLTEEVWSLIYQSASRCPTELRTVFRHIRACADDRYGERLRSVPYSSVSGFIFLRFFCPAILNPSIFGLVTDIPRTRAQRCFTLVAKSLQGLANQTNFGAKEPWMEPMNKFLQANRAPFRTFIDAACSVQANQPSTSSSPSYSTPLAIFTRIPPAAREGFPSLPYLIDPSRNFAALVNLWADNFNESIGRRPLEYDLLAFHNECLGIRQKTHRCYERAERTEKFGSSMSEKWEAIAKQLDAKPSDFWIDLPPATTKVADVVPKFETLDMNTSKSSKTVKIGQTLPATKLEGPQVTEISGATFKSSAHSSRPSTISRPSEDDLRASTKNRQIPINRLRSRSRSQADSTGPGHTSSDPTESSDEETEEEAKPQPRPAPAKLAKKKTKQKSKEQSKRRNKSQERELSTAPHSTSRRGIFGRKRKSDNKQETS